MASDGRIVIDVVLDDGRVVNGVADLSRLFGGLGRTSESSALSIGKVVTALGLVAAARKGIDMVTSSISGAIARVDTLSGFPVVMERMGFSSDQAKSSIDKLSEGISGLPTTLDGIVKSTQSIALMTGDLDVATDTALALNNAFLASGSSSADAERGLVQYVQMLAKGKVDMVSWQTLQETMGFALNKTAEAFGFTGKSAQRDLYSALQKGKITFEDFNAKLIELNNGVGGFAEVAKASSAGIATAFANMRTAVVRGVANIIQSLQDVLAKTPLQSIENILGLIGKAFSNVLNAIAAGIPTAVDMIMNLYHNLEPWMPLITSIAGAVGIMVLSFAAFNTTITIIGNVRKAITALNATVLANPWTWVALAAITAVLLIIQYWEPITQFFKDLWADVTETFNTALTAIQSFATSMSEVVSEITTTLSTSLSAVWSSISSGFTTAINGLLTGLSSLKEKLSIVKDIIDVEKALNLLKFAAEAVLSSILMLLGPWGMLANILLKVFTHTTLLQDTFKMLKGEMTFDEVASNFSESISGVIENITELSTRLVTVGAKLVVGLINGVSSNIGKFATAFAEILPVVIDTLVMIVPQIILLAADIVTKLAEGITTNLPIVVKAIVSLIELVTTTIGTLLPQLVEVGVSLLTTIINGIITALPMLIEVVVQLLNTIINSLTMMLPLLIETGLTIVETLLNGIVTALPLIVESALNIVMSLVDALTAALPQLIQVGLLVLNTLIEGIIGALPIIIEAALTIVIALVAALILLLPQLIEAGIQIIMALVQGLIKALPAILEAIVTLIMSLVKAIIELLPQLLDAGVQIVMALVKGLIQVLPQLIEAGITLVVALVEAIIQLLPELLSAGAELIVALVKGVLSILGQLLAAGAKLILGLLGKILSFVGQLLAAGVTLIGKLISGILSLLGDIISAGAKLITGLIDKILSFLGKILTAGKDLVGNLIDGVLSKVNDMINVGKDLVSGLIKGITNMTSNAIEAITGVVDGVISKAKSLLGIHSPSRVFKQIGNWTSEGWAIGIEETGDRVVDAVSDIALNAKDIAEHYASEEKKLRKDAADQIAKIEKDKNDSIAKLQRNASESNQKAAQSETQKINAIYAAAKKKKRNLTKDEIAKVQKLRNEASSKRTKNSRDTNEKIAKIEEQAATKIKKIKEKSTKDIVSLDNKMYKDLYEETKRYIDDKKSLDQLSLIDEARIWEQSLKLYADGSKERVRAQQEHKKAVDAINKEVLSINQSYQQEMQKINDDLIKQEQALNKEYEDAFNKRYDKLFNSTGLFDEFKRNTEITGKELLDNLQGQVYGFREWRRAMDDLAMRGVGEELLKDLSEMGPKALGELQALNQLSAVELEKYSNLYKEKSADARNQTERELKTMREDADKQIKELRETAKKQLTTLQTEWREKIKALTTTTQNEMSSLKQVGVDAAQGLLDGLKSMDGELQKQAKSIANSIKWTIQDALDIHSPSRWMRDFVAGNLARGFDVGVDRQKSFLTNASEKIGDFIKPSIVNPLRGAKVNLGLNKPSSMINNYSTTNNISGNAEENSIQVETSDVVLYGEKVGEIMYKVVSGKQYRGANMAAMVKGVASL